VTQYERGSRLERDVARRMSERGFYVMRAAGSHGVADLVAFDVRRSRPARRRWLPWLVNCKFDRHDVLRAEWNALHTLADVAGMGAYIADRSGPRRIPQIWRVDNERTDHARIDRLLTPVPWDMLPLVPKRDLVVEPTWGDLADAYPVVEHFTDEDDD